jgi:hypothetical protein
MAMNTQLARAVVLCLGSLILCSPSFLRADSLKMAHGWSVHPNGGEVAVNEAIAMMQKKVKNPRFIVIYTTADYGEQETVQTLQSRFPGAKLLGMNVYKGVFSIDGLHIGENGSLAIMGFSGGDLVFGVSAREVAEGADVISLTKETFADAARDAGKTLDDVPSVVLLGAMKGKENDVIAGISAILSRDVPLVGGTHCDDRFGQGYVMANDNIFKPGIIVGLIYSQGNIGASFYSGFVGKKKSGKITSGEGRILKEIDGRPAQEVYREWAHGHFDNIDSSNKSVMVMSSSTCPLAKAIRVPSGKMRYVPVRPWRFNPDGSLNMGGDIHENDTIYYVEGNKRALRRRAAVVAKKAMVNGKIKMKEIAGGLHIYCAGAAKTLGLNQGDDTDKMVDDIRKAMGGKPFIGGFTAGEQGNIPGYGFFHGNLMSSMVVFSK